MVQVKKSLKNIKKCLISVQLIFMKLLIYETIRLLLIKTLRIKSLYFVEQANTKQFFKLDRGF